MKKCILSASLFSIVLPFLFAQNYSDIVVGVDTVWTSGTPGPVFPSNSLAIPIVSGHPETANFPSTFFLASVFGTGRVIGFGHDGFFANGSINSFDNIQLALNTFDWLDIANTNTVRITIGHGEFFNPSNATTLTTQLATHGYTSSALSGTITSADLVGVGVLVIGNAWQPVTPTEVSVIQNFVQSGGGLLLAGLGWSWNAYNAGGMDAYPMNKVGELFGIRWIDGFITDNVHSFNGSPLFLGFYPHTKSYTVAGACQFVDSVTAAHPADLAATIQNNPTLRTSYIEAHLWLKETVNNLLENNSARADVYNCYKTLLNNYPAYFQKGTVYNSATENNMAWIRERAHRTFADALPHTPVRKTEIALTLNLTDLYLDIWNEFSILLADNSRLDTAQKDFLYTMFSLTPPQMHDLGLMSFADYIGQPPVTNFGAIPSFLIGINSGINSFSTPYWRLS